MEQKNSQTYKVDKKYHKDILDFVKLNKIEDTDTFVNKCFKKGFDLERFGLLGIQDEVKEVVKEVEIEKIVEKIVEVPVEKIVERIKEVQSPPIEIEVIKYVDREIVKEIPVEKVVTKIEYIRDENPTESEEKIFQLKEELEQGRQKFSTNIKEMENNFQKEKDELLLKIQQMENEPPKLVEIIKEVSIDKIVEVEKPNDKVKLLENTLQNLRKDLFLKQTTIKELEDKLKNSEEQLDKNLSAIYLKGSNLNEKI